MMERARGVVRLLEVQRELGGVLGRERAVHALEPRTDAAVQARAPRGRQLRVEHLAMERVQELVAAGAGRGVDAAPAQEELAPGERVAARVDLLRARLEPGRDRRARERRAGRARRLEQLA